jgi:ribosome maturation factor RimP
MDLEALLGPLVEGMGLELVEAGFARDGGRRVLRVTVDRAGGVDLDTIARASEKVSRRLDLEDFGGGPYVLEVSSPGLERPLRRPEHFARQVGAKVKVKTMDLIDGSRTHLGTLVAVGDDDVTIETEGGPRTLRFADIATARTVFEWGPRSKPKTKKDGS